MFNKKGQMSAGLITGLVFGVASLVIGVIIAFVIVSTLGDANLLSEGRTSSAITVNESGWINETGYTFVGAGATRFVSGSISLNTAYNGSDVLTSANYTISDAGIIINATATEFSTEVNLTYTYTLKNLEEITTTSLNANFTKGVDNVSKKIPTVLLVAAIVLILGVLALLVATWQRMRLGGGSI